MQVKKNKPIKDSLASLEEKLIDAKNAGDTTQMKIIQVMIKRIKNLK
jgi:hypothetical protein